MEEITDLTPYGLIDCVRVWEVLHGSVGAVYMNDGDYEEISRSVELGYSASVRGYGVVSVVNGIDIITDSNVPSGYLVIRGRESYDREVMAIRDFVESYRNDYIKGIKGGFVLKD